MQGLGGGQVTIEDSADGQDLGLLGPLGNGGLVAGEAVSRADIDLGIANVPAGEGVALTECIGQIVDGHQLNNINNHCGSTVDGTAVGVQSQLSSVALLLGAADGADMVYEGVNTGGSGLGTGSDHSLTVGADDIAGVALGDAGGSNRIDGDGVGMGAGLAAGHTDLGVLAEGMGCLGNAGAGQVAVSLGAFLPMGQRVVTPNASHVVGIVSDMRICEGLEGNCGNQQDCHQHQAEQLFAYCFHGIFLLKCILQI